MPLVKNDILIDGRALLDSQGGGVFEYTRRVVEKLREFENISTYVWANQFSRKHKVITTIDKMTHWPNKILHAGTRFISNPKLDRIAGVAGKLFWAPNPHFISISNDLPFVLTMHDLSFERYPEFFSRKQRLWHKAVNPKALCRRAERILTVSSHTKRDIVDLYNIDPNRIVITHEGCDDLYQRTPSPKILEEVRSRLALPKHFILHIGTLEPRKNHLGLLTAFEILKTDARFSDLHLVLAGPSGWNNDNILRAIRESRYRESITLLGFVDETDKPSLYRLAQIFVFPSFYEGFGLPALEAMASGTPVIASFSASLGEMIDDAGLLIDPYRPSEIADAIVSVLESPALGAELSKRGRMRAKNFSWHACSKKTAEVFQTILPLS